MRRALAAALLLTPLVAWLLHALVVAAIVPIVMNFAVAGVFALSWWRGDPLIARFARLEGKPLSQKEFAYCRRWTVVWSLYLAGLGAVGIAVAVQGDARVVAWWSGLVDYALIAFLFVGELWYRRGSPRGVLDQLRNVRDVMRKSA